MKPSGAFGVGPVAQPPQGGSVPNTLVLLALSLAFVDEGVRKVLPDNPVVVTGLKDLLICCVGAWALVRVAGLRRHFPLMIPWALFALWSCLTTAAEFGNGLFLVAALRTYLGLLLVLCAGYYVGTSELLLRRVSRLFLAGAVVGLGVALWQELAREHLPAFFSARIYIEGHDEAGGKYNEALFASPQVWAQCAVLALTGVFVNYCIADRLRAIVPNVLLVMGLALGVYLSRIRIAVLFAALAALAAWILSRRSSPSAGPNRRGAALIKVAVAVALVLIGISTAITSAAWRGTSGLDVEQEKDFFAYLLDGDELISRATFFITESADLEGHDWLVGYGAGLGGSLRHFLGESSINLPNVLDTGVFLLFHEFGAVGLVAFLVAIGGLTGRCGVRMVRDRRLRPEVIWSFLSAAVLLLWFLLKSHTCLMTGFSQLMWFGNLGVCLALLDRPSVGGTRPWCGVSPRREVG